MGSHPNYYIYVWLFGNLYDYDNVMKVGVVLYNMFFLHLQTHHFFSQGYSFMFI